MGMKPTDPLRTVVGLVLAVLALAACAGQGTGGAAAGGATTGPVLTTTTMRSPTTRPPPPGGGQLTATGTVKAGVEPGCLLLEADQDGTYLLVGGEREELRPGARVQVTGKVARDLLSTCQQGVPLVVSSIRPAR
jgi:hypothetical protein